MIVFGLFYHKIGPKLIMQIACVAHTIGILMTVFADGYSGLLISTLLLGIGNGCTEAACNPMIADTYSGVRMNKMLNRFHMWFPGGIVLGALVSTYMTRAELGWESQIWVMLVPTVIYAYLFFGQKFPKPKVEESVSLGINLKAMVSPLFLFIFVAMALTANSEFQTTNWVMVVLGSNVENPMIITAVVFGVMTVGRFFAGPVVKALDQTGVLLLGAILASVGIYMFSTFSGSISYLSAFIYGLGICYFWPVMVGVIAQRVPKSGALGMSVIGGWGMLSAAIFNPIVGGWIDNSKADFSAEGLSGDALELATGQDVLGTLTFMPAILIVLFLVLFIWQRAKKN
jgi:MFS family permease